MSEIKYDKVVQKAMLNVIREILTDVSENGLPGKHHFYITYCTTAPGVEMPAHLLERYPEEVTIVLQHEFQNLKVEADYVSVTLWFSGVPAHLLVPFSAIRAFFDPYVKFGLQFSPIVDEDASSESEAAEDMVDSDEIEKNEKDDQAEKVSDSSKIISIDAFRKK